MAWRVSYGKKAQEVTAQGALGYGMLDSYEKPPVAATQIDPIMVHSLADLNLRHLRDHGITLADNSGRMVKRGTNQVPEEVVNPGTLASADLDYTYVLPPLYEAARNGVRVQVHFDELTNDERAAPKVIYAPLYCLSYNGREVPLNFYRDAKNNAVVIPGAEKRLLRFPADGLAIGFRPGLTTLKDSTARTLGVGSLYDELEPFNLQDLERAMVGSNVYTFPVFDTAIGADGKLTFTPRMNAGNPVFRYEIRDFVERDGRLLARGDYVPGAEGYAKMQEYQEEYLVFRNINTGQVFYLTEKDLVSRRADLSRDFGLGWSAKDIGGASEHILAVNAREDTPGAFKDIQGNWRIGVSLPKGIRERKLAGYEDRLSFDDAVGFNTEGKGKKVAFLLNDFDNRGYLNTPLVTKEEMMKIGVAEVGPRAFPALKQYLWFKDQERNGFRNGIPEADEEKAWFDFSPFDMASTLAGRTPNTNALPRCNEEAKLTGWRPVWAFGRWDNDRFISGDYTPAGRAMMAEIYREYLVFNDVDGSITYYANIQDANLRARLGLKIRHGGSLSRRNAEGNTIEAYFPARKLTDSRVVVVRENAPAEIYGLDAAGTRP